MGYVKMVGTTNPHTNWTTEVVLGRDEETGEVTKSVKQGEPVDLSAADQKKLEGLGYVFEKSSKDEHDTFVEQQEAQTQTVGADIAGAAPLLGNQTDQPNQPSAGAGDISNT